MLMLMLMLMMENSSNASVNDRWIDSSKLNIRYYHPQTNYHLLPSATNYFRI